MLVLKTDGTNCDEEAQFAFTLAGAEAQLIHVNQIRENKRLLDAYQILVLPGGFSYGDDIASGKILAIELTSFLSEQIKRFIERKNTLTIGICNGFQTLVRTGILPFGTIGTMQTTLTNNDSGHFECRWIRLKTEKNTRCVFLKNMEKELLSYQVAHGEGKFYAPFETLEQIEKEHLVVFRYADEKGYPTQKYPDNPNGSLNAIAGICDPTGRVLGLMPHPERFVRFEHHPNWRRMNNTKPQGLPVFENMVKFVKKA